MFEFLENLQDKPDHHKRAIAFGISFAVTGFIFLFWVSSFFVDIGSSTVVVTLEDKKTNSEAKKSDSPSPVDSIRNGVAQVSSALGSLRSVFDNLNSIEYKSK